MVRIVIYVASYIEIREIHGGIVAPKLGIFPEAEGRGKYSLITHA